MTQPETRNSLILRLGGDRCESAWSDFVRLYEPFVRRLVLRQGVPQRHREDVAQQILAAVARGVGSWRDDGDPASFRRWLARVARNVTLRFLTREGRQPGGIGGSDLQSRLEQAPERPDSIHEARYDLELVLWAAEQVRGEFRESSWRAFWGTLVEQREVAAVAAELGVSAGAIYMARSRIVARIRELVRALDEHDESPRISERESEGDHRMCQRRQEQRP